MTGESDVSKTRIHTNTSRGRPFSRSFKKRFQQNQSSTSSNSNSTAFNDKIYANQNDKAVQIAQLTSHLEQALKQHADILQKNIYHPLPEIIMEISGNNKNTVKSSSANGIAATTTHTSVGGINTATTPPTSAATTTSTNKLNNLPKPKETFAESNEQSIEKGLKALKSGNTLIVIRGLIGLILAMDYTCNMDLFLLTCKVNVQFFFLWSEICKLNFRFFVVR